MQYKLSKNITGPNQENLGEILTVFRRKYKNFRQWLRQNTNFNDWSPIPQSRSYPEDGVGVAAQAINEQLFYANMPPHLKKSINQAHLENGTYEQIVSHLQRHLELNGLEAPDEMQINNVTQQAPQQNSENPKPTCHHCKKPGRY